MIRFFQLFSVFFILFLSCGNLRAQQAAGQPVVIQFSGIVTSSDSTYQEPIPFVNISVKNSRRGTVSDVHGYFSIPVYSTDTLLFSALGYNSVEFIFEDIPPQQKVFLTIQLTEKSYNLQTITIYGLTKDNFKQAFLTLEIPNEAYYYKVNPKIFPTSQEVAATTVPLTGIRVSPSEILKKLPAIQEATEKKKYKRQMDKVQESGEEIPVMK